ncbi:MAG: 50S ribosomal protein L22 [Phycisphaeraceae bacterium]|nr:MAG: 50S ribosomal protein L22 [Phycisphaeraceae bacterium]
MDARGVGVDQLAAAVERDGLKGERALSAVRNWIRGNDHPRCKPADAAKLAGALGVRVTDIARFTSSIFGHRGSPRKAKLLVDLIRGKTIDQAISALSFTTKRAAVDVKKCLDAAVADAQQFEADVTNLVVAESRCDHGLRMKRFQPKDRGRAHPIIKRFSNITIGVQERTGR